jgi:hypothetical protein
MRDPHGFALHEQDIGHTFLCGPTDPAKPCWSAF